MNTQSAPTEPQLRYLRALASRTATTFATPVTRGDASREIERLRRLQTAPRERIAHEDLAYATAVHEDELAGFGATRSWRSHPPSRTASPPRIASPRLLARYALSSGERRIDAIASRMGLTVRDLPADGAGDAYTVEVLSHQESGAELSALIADYLKRARELDAIPMSREAMELHPAETHDV